jgi:prevent-host-death family protein
MKRVSVAEAKNHLPSLLHDAERAPVEIVRRGKPIAVIVSRTAYDRLRGQHTDAWAALQRWRTSVDLEELDLEGVLDNVRDRSPARRVGRSRPSLS